MASRLQWPYRETSQIVEGRPHVPRRRKLGRGFTIGPVENSQCFERELKAASAELVYGSSLRLRGDFFAPSPVECTDVTDFVSRLRAHIGKLRPVPAYRHEAPSTFIIKALATAPHLFLRHCVLRITLQVPTSAHIRFSTGAIRPKQATLMVLRRKSPLTA